MLPIRNHPPTGAREHPTNLGLRHQWTRGSASSTASLPFHRTRLQDPDQHPRRDPSRWTPPRLHSPSGHHPRTLEHITRGEPCRFGPRPPPPPRPRPSLSDTAEQGRNPTYIHPQGVPLAYLISPSTGNIGARPPSACLRKELMDSASQAPRKRLDFLCLGENATSTGTS